MKVVHSLADVVVMVESGLTTSRDGTAAVWLGPPAAAAFVSLLLNPAAATRRSWRTLEAVRSTRAG